MKFSEILRTTTDLSSQAVLRRPPEPAKIPSKGQPRDFSETPEKSKKEAQTELEKEFKEKLAALQEEARRSQEAVLKAEEEKFFARAEILKKEKQQLASQLEELRKQNQELRLAQTQVEEIKHQMISSQEKMADQFQRKLAEMEMTFLEKQKALEAKKDLEALERESRSSEARAQEAERLKAEERIRERERKVKEQEQAKEQSQLKREISAEIEPSSFSSSPILENKPQPRELSSEDFEVSVSPQAREIYGEVVAYGQKIFDQAAQGQALDFEGFSKTLLKMARALPSHDDDLINIAMEPYPEGDSFAYHGANIAVMALALGLDFKLSSQDLDDLGIAAFLHDIGLVNAKEGLAYPKQLTAPMREEMAQHPERGAGLLASYANERILTAIRQHHELGNGKGYPKGLLNDQIDLFAKIINISDSFEAMIHVRPYRPQPYEVSQAVKEMIEKERGLYDRDVMKALLGRVGLYPVRSFVELSNRQVAKILRQNRQFPLSPVIQIEFDEEGGKLSRPLVIDLTKNQLLHIIGPLKTVNSFATEKLEQDGVRKKKVHAQQQTRLFVWELLPLVLIVIAIALVVYLVIKI